eukprot:Rmarinus@m.1089
MPVLALQQPHVETPGCNGRGQAKGDDVNLWQGDPYWGPRFPSASCRVPPLTPRGFSVSLSVLTPRTLPALGRKRTPSPLAAVRAGWIHATASLLSRAGATVFAIHLPRPKPPSSAHTDRHDSGGTPVFCPCTTRESWKISYPD